MTDTMTIYGKKGKHLAQFLVLATRICHHSPGTKGLASADIALLELGARALRKDLVSTHALGARGNRNPGDGKLLGAHADLLSIGRANGLTG